MVGVTSPTRRDVEGRLAALADDSDGATPGSRTVESWIQSHLETSPGATVTFADETPPTDRVHALADPAGDLYVPAAVVPDWIDPETDLPLTPP